VSAGNRGGERATGRYRQSDAETVRGREERAAVAPSTGTAGGRRTQSSVSRNLVYGADAATRGDSSVEAGAPSYRSNRPPSSGRRRADDTRPRESPAVGPADVDFGVTGRTTAKAHDQRAVTRPVERRTRIPVRTGTVVGDRRRAPRRHRPPSPADDAPFHTRRRGRPPAVRSTDPCGRASESGDAGMWRVGTDDAPESGASSRRTRAVERGTDRRRSAVAVSRPSPDGVERRPRDCKRDIAILNLQPSAKRRP
jgi:hypothetical protein